MAETENWTPGPWRIRDEDGPPTTDVMVGERLLATAYPEHYRRDGISEPASSILRSYAEAEANARLIAQSPRFADIAARAQYLANERGGDYWTLSKDELCAFMVEFDEALSDARGEP